MTRGERVQELMMAALDGEVSDTERRELESLIEGSDGLREEWLELSRVKRMTSGVSLKSPPEEIWEDYMSSVFLKVERSVGWILTSIGAVVLLSYGLWMGTKNLIQDSSVPWFLKGAILSLVVGLTVITVSVAREKLFMRARDPYKKVVR
ncbi:MAG: anti-sigma factor family protein [Gemmatimonadales bacterium]